MLTTPNANNPKYALRDTRLDITRFLNMLGVKSQSGFQGYAYIILQVIRCCNIAVFLAVIVASVLKMIFAKMPNGYQFFDDVMLVFVVCVASLLTYTETGISYGQELIATTWPVFGPNRGFTWLGVSMFLMGCNLLGSLSNDTYTKKSVPSQIGQVVMGAGIIAIAFGTINIIASLAFRNRHSGLKAREVRNNGATTKDFNMPEEYDSYRSASVRKEKPKNRITRLFGGRDDKPKISHPIAQDVESGLEVYPEDRSSPVIPNLQRPPTAQHPMYLAGNRTSRYSEVSHLDRFNPDNKI